MSDRALYQHRQPLGENTSRALLYVAMTRGRESNQAYLYERIAGEGEHEHAEQTTGVHVARRGGSRAAAQLVRAIIANLHEQARTAHHIAAETSDPGQLPDRIHRLFDRRATAVATRRTATRHGADRPATGSSTGSSAATSSSAAAATTASTTASTSKST